ncbi:sirohydrochlorin cobaltochelatase [Heliobacillus mobilis]|uniref:Sirohydrochlorin cobaltochelatase n=2 Tax=Heliobacterium TaxID=2697 RepID=A0A6I3SML5_HELMO|nr:MULTISPECIES: CbiX/SirB N-terminal domain-containing protein [Heliobacterium]MBC9785782.1 CbiX/SirB N-terminal domain-containing protein [Heliobacterium chlorum]MTV50238.1 sirohydrochlorin cobaltochelatase [Heliobacterium mobile]
MKTGVLLVAHGSRLAEANSHAVNIGNMVRKFHQIDPLVVCFMENAKPNLAEGIEELVALGVDEVKVIPLFLYNGVHIQKDIPEELEEIGKAHPQLRFTMGRPLGADERIAQLIFERIQEVG